VNALPLEPIPDGATNLLALENAVALANGPQTVAQLIINPKIEAASCHKVSQYTHVGLLSSTTVRPITGAASGQLVALFLRNRASLLALSGRQLGAAERVPVRAPSASI
jgi:hypothetical protein